MATYGLSEEDFKPPEVGVWPDNFETVEVYGALRTQWRFSQYGATGLDYAVVPTVLKLVEVPEERWSDIFEGIRVMEVVELISLRQKQQEGFEDE